MPELLLLAASSGSITNRVLIAGAQFSEYRMKVTQNAGAQYWCIEELSFYDGFSKRLATVPSGGSAQTEYATKHAAEKAFNEVTNADESYYCSKNGVKTGWLQYNFGSPTIVSSYAIERLNGHGNQFSPVAWTFQGSTDGTTWSTLDTQSGHNSWGDGEVRNFAIGECEPRFVLQAREKICSDSEGKQNLGGPNWPAGSSTAASKVACAAACLGRSGCTHYTWFSNRGCRTFTSCNTLIDGFSDMSEYICKRSGKTLDLSPFILDTTVSTPTEQTAVPTPTNNPTPNVVIKTSEAGTIAVGGTAGCGLSSSAAVSLGVNTVTLSATDGEKEYRCTITFTDTAGNVASALALSPFMLDKTVSAPTEQTAVPTPTNDATPNVVIKTSEAGTIIVGGTAGCGLSSSAAVSLEVNTVTLSASDGAKEYRCMITFTDAAGNVASALALSPFKLRMANFDMGRSMQFENDGGVVYMLGVRVPNVRGHTLS